MEIASKPVSGRSFVVKCIMFIAAICLFSSCGKKYDYLNFEDVSGEQWSYTDTLSFQIDESFGDDDVVQLMVRHNAQYSFQNLWVEMRSFSSGELVDSSRQEIFLAQNSGRWLGTKGGAIYTITDTLNVDLQGFSVDSMTMSQVMRQDPLIGVNAIGLVVE